MLMEQKIAIALMFLPLAIGISYMDVRYRRIPNKLVFAVLVAGLMLNTLFRQWHGLVTSLGGLALAFGLMFTLHAFGTMGAGDVKLFAAIGSMVGTPHVLPTLFVVALSGGVLAFGKMIYARRTGRTMVGVAQFFYGLLPGHTIPRFEVTDHTVTLPYAVPICFGAMVSLFLFGA